jgi:hypothetical protein
MSHSDFLQMNEIEHPKKRAMLQALEKTLGIVTTASKLVPISPVTHYNWLKEDKVYADAVYQIGESCIDFVESKLLELINSGDTTATIFFLKAKAKQRGYIEKQQLEHSGTLSHEATVTIVNKPNGS